MHGQGRPYPAALGADQCRGQTAGFPPLPSTLAVLNVFDTHCPTCGATVSAVAAVCACGHVLNALYLEDQRAALEAAAREEALIEEYLAARVEQAAAIARRAVRAALKDPEAERKLWDAVEAQRAVIATRTELARQRVRTAEARTRLHAHNAHPADGKPDTAPGERSWQAVIVREALKAGGAGAVRMRTQPSPGFHAAQAERADQVARATRVTGLPAPLAVVKETAARGQPLRKGGPGKSRA